jgi:ABC-2 type transport system ATP-binding protein
MLRVRGEADDLIETIRKIKGITSVQPKEDGVLEFQFAPGQDVRANVARTTVEEGFDLLEMRPIGMSLEDIFLQLTREENVEIEA